MNNIIVAEGLTKVYKGGLKAVDNIDFFVKEGEIFGFLGPNGAGKSTTIAMLTTLIKPTKGKANVVGLDIVKYPYQVRLAIGYVSQDLAVDDALTGFENLRLQAGFYHIPKSEIAGRINEVLEMVELKDRAKDKVETYSGGMRKRLDIACGLIHRPKLLFLDEPTLGLDIQTRREIWKYINHLREEIKMTIFMTTYYMDEADSLCDRISIIDKGVIKVSGTPALLKQSLGNEIVEFRFDSINGQVNSALEMIKELDFVNELTESSSGSFRLLVNNGEASVPALFNALNKFNSELKISSISFKQPTLDDVFLHHTGRELRDDSAGKEDAFRRRILMRRTRK
jgi:ABC-2 type transport system ATP-binding protein